MASMLPSNFLTKGAFSVIGIIFFVSIVNPWIFLATGPFVILFFWLRAYYMHLGREIKRLEAVARSPVFSHFSTSITGLPIIRCHQAGPRFIQQMYEHLNHHGRAFYVYLTAARWLGVRLDSLSAFLVGITVFVAIAARHSINPGLIALSISYTLQLMAGFQWTVRQSAEVESQMTSVERVLEYSALAPEETADQQKQEPPVSWPHNGAFEFDNVHMRYSADVPTSLSGISFKVAAGEKIGVVGRTGAGKSSLLYALFRLSLYIDGEIYIDGLPTSKIPLQTLRSKISVIPQDPVLFSGSIKYNLDPFSEYPDDDIWKALEDVRLREAVEKIDGGLNGVVSESGGNFSVGQRQLLCLARAILR